jgi:type IV pilus assembly protein PilO
VLNQFQSVWRYLQAIARHAAMTSPMWVRLLACSGVSLTLFGLLWVLWLSAVQQDMTDAQATHERLRTELTTKLLRASTLTGLQSEKSRRTQRLKRLETQLPGPHDMDVLFADMYRSGRARHLRFELLRPAESKPMASYAQQLIAVRVSGRYDDIAGFAADIAGLAWLVSIQSFTLVPTKDGRLSLDAVVCTLRPLNMTVNPTTTKVTH